MGEVQIGATVRDGQVVDTLTLRFAGFEEDGTPIAELRAAHVAEVLQGLTGLTGDFAKAGAFGDGPAGSEVLVRPAREGSFVIEVLRWVSENQGLAGMAAAVSGAPTLGQIVWWATKSARADVSDFEYLDNGEVKVLWQDNTVDEVPRAVWDELKVRKRRRKSQLRQLMAPYSDERVTSLELTDGVEEESPPEAPDPGEPRVFDLSRDDYHAVRDEDEIEEHAETFEVEARMSAVDFDDAGKWRVRTADRTRSATVEDEEFLGRVRGGMPIRNSDIFRLRVRADTVVKNGRRSTKWTVLEVLSHRRAAHDDDD